MLLQLWIAQRLEAQQPLLDFLLTQHSGPGCATAVGPFELFAKGGSAAIQLHPDVYVVNRGEHAEDAALVIARGLRQLGLSVELDAGGSAFGKQFKRADRSGAAWALVLGDEEVQQGSLRLKPLRDSSAEERSLDLHDWASVAALVRP